jgi:hypothetical protein
LGAKASVGGEIAAFWQQQGGIGRLVLILAATSAMKEAVLQTVPIGACLVLGGGEIEGLLTKPHPLEVLKQHLRKEIPIRRLVPYDLMHPAPPNMFFGRRDILDRLRSDVATSFAIAGPGRIGKSSLLGQYHYELRRDFRDERRSRLRWIDFYACRGLDADALARRIALHISADSEANRVSCGTLLRFLRRFSRHGREPVELLLDEVDTICLNPAFSEVGEAVHNGYCRVILCGKGNLHRMIRSMETRVSQRVELIEPGPLDCESAKKLLVEPLTDLGFRLSDESSLCDGVIVLAQRRPHLIQACAKRLIELALGDRSEIITLGHLQRVREDFTALGNVVLPLDDMQDDLTRLVALLWLRNGGEIVTVGGLQALAEEEALALGASKALEICYDLWICGVLTCEKGTFAVGNPGLGQFVRQMNYDKEIGRLKNVLTARGGVAVVT